MMFKKILFSVFSVLFVLTAVIAFVYGNQLSIVKEMVYKEMAIQELSVKLSDLFNRQDLDLEDIKSLLQAGREKPHYVFIYVTFGLTCPACRESMTEFAKEINRYRKYVDYIEVRCGEMPSEKRSVLSCESNILLWKKYQLREALIVYDRHSQHVLSVHFPDQPFQSIDYTLLWRSYIKTLVTQ